MANMENTPWLSSNTHFNCFSITDTTTKRQYYSYSDIALLNRHTQMSHHLTKPTKWPVCPAKTLISLSIQPVWSEFTVCSMGAKDPNFLQADSEDSDQTGQIPRLIWVSTWRMLFCWFCHAAAQIYLSIIMIVSWSILVVVEMYLMFICLFKAIPKTAKKCTGHVMGGNLNLCMLQLFPLITNSGSMC